MTWADSAGRLGQFVESAIISTACVQIVSHAREILDKCLDETPSGGATMFHDVVVQSVKQYCIDPLGMSFSDNMVGRFAEHAYRCADVARRSISDRSRGVAFRQAAIARGGSISCYICDSTLGNLRVVQRIKDVALDHLWPRAFGGVSTEENLLPICSDCNGLKMDRISWDVFGVVQDYSITNNGTNGRVLTKMALHRRAAGRLAELEGITLKEAFIKLGPFQSLKSIHPDGGKWFFNRTAHDTCVLPDLW
jgi:hypothetical protein